MANQTVPLRSDAVHILAFDFANRIARILSDTGATVTLSNITVAVEDSTGEDVTATFIDDDPAPYVEGAKGFAWKLADIPAGTYTVVCTGTFSDGQTFDLTSDNGDLPTYRVTD